MQTTVDASKQPRYTGQMKVTIDLPEALYRRVKAQAAADGRTVRDVTIELYERWLPPAPHGTEEQRLAAAEAWLEEWFRLGDELRATLPGPPPTADEIVADIRADRDR
jgi:hypothetical protein